MTLQELRKRTDRVLSDYRHALRSKKEEAERLEKVKEKVSDCEQAQILVQNTAQYVQEQVHKQIAKVVSRCLQDVFGEDAYEFQINFIRKRGRTEAQLQFVRNGMVLENPKDQAGVGQIEVASIALRLLAVMLSVPRKRRLIVTDEPTHFVNGVEYQKRVAGLVEKLAEEMEVQWIIVSDDDWLKLGKVTQL